MTEAYPPSARVRRRADYRRIQSSRGRVHTRLFLIVLASSPVEAPRLGVTVTKKVGNAVARNRIKRVVREVFRRNRALFPPHTDLVFIAKQGAERVTYAELLRDLVGVREALAQKRDRLPAPTPADGAARSGSSS